MHQSLNNFKKFQQFFYDQYNQEDPDELFWKAIKNHQTNQIGAFDVISLDPETLPKEHELTITF